MDTHISKNIFYTSLSNIIPSILSFLFWFIVSNTVGSEAVGISSIIISFVTIVATVISLNISIGMKRSLGQAFSSGDLSIFKHILISSIIFVCIGIIISSIVISIPEIGILKQLGIDYQYIWIVVTMIPALVLNSIFSESLTASLNSKKLIFPMVIGSAVRFPIFFAIIFLFEEPNLGTIIAFTSTIFISTLGYYFYQLKIFRIKSERKIIDLSTTKQLLRDSVVSWIPLMITTLGYHLGFIMVFTSQGPEESGKFYIPMSIMMIILFILAGINRVSHSLIAGMDSSTEQVNFLKYAMKIAFILTIPISMSVLFFAEDFLFLFGDDFGTASKTLNILMMAVPILIITEMIYYFIYGRGDNKSILYLGLSSSCVRIILYFILIPELGGMGAAISFLCGSVVQLILSVIIGKKHSLILQYRKYLIINLIPLTIGFTFWVLNIHFIISLIVIIIGSLLVYIKIHLFTEKDLHNILFTGFSENQAEKIYSSLVKILRKIS